MHVFSGTTACPCSAVTRRPAAAGVGLGGPRAWDALQALFREGEAAETQVRAQEPRLLSVHGADLEVEMKLRKLDL